MENNIIMMTTLDINTAPPFSTLFLIKEKVLNEIISDMKIHGYDYAHPVVLWAGHKATVLDGHTRLRAALTLGMTKIPITLKEFASEDEALRYAIKSQSSRRNLTDAELLSCLAELDKRKAEGRPKKTPPDGGVSGRSSAATAEVLGISPRKVERLRAVQDHASDDVKEAVATGGISVNKAYNETMYQRRNTSDGDAAAEKPERTAALIKSIDGMSVKRLEREVQEYPELEYSDDEIEAMAIAISDIIRRNLKTILHKEHEGEKHYGNA